MGDEQEDEVLERGVESEDSCIDSEGNMSGGLQFVGQSALAGDIEDGMTCGGAPGLEEGMADDFSLV